VVVVALVGGLALRCWVIASPLGAVDLDEATVGLQARSFRDGSTQAFFPNQGYGGTAETWIVALAFALFGDGVVTLKVVPTALHLAAAVVVWRVACRTTSSTIGQLSPPILMWVGSPYAVWWSTKERGFYGVAIVLAAVVLLLVVRLHRRDRRADAALLGLCLGVALWTTPLLAAAVAPPVVWLAVRRPGLWRRLPLLSATALVGALPSIVWNLRNDWASLEAPYGYGATWWGRVDDWGWRVGSLAGFATPFDPDRTLLPGSVVVIGAIGLLVASTWVSRRSVPGLVPACILGYGALQGFNGLAVAVGPDDRYVYPMLPALALTFGLAVPEARPRRTLLSSTMTLHLLVAGSFAVSTWGLVGLRDLAQVPEPDVFLASPGIEAVIDLLDQRHVEAVTTDLTGQQILFLTGGDVAASSFSVPRDDAIERQVARSGRCTYVLRRGHRDDLALEELVPYLERREIGLVREDVGVFSVLFLDTPVDPADVPLTWYAGPVPRLPDVTPRTTC
jgi:hypothetical protein